MNLLLFVGFLGSGKTSILLPMARYLVAREGVSPDKTPVVIIENEVGEVAIDNVVLSREGLDVREIFGGCICCQLTADLASTLKELAAGIDPAWVLVEATGIGVPGPIVDTVKKYCPEVRHIITVTVVDAQRWFELLMIVEPLVTKQVEDANRVLVNKIDLVDEAGLNAVKESLSCINSSAPVLEISVPGGISETMLQEVTCI